MIRKKDVDPCKNYPIELHYVVEDDGPNYFFAFHPDFGASACSATGYTIPQAISNLAQVRGEVILAILQRKEKLPKPSPHPFERDTVNAQRCSFACPHAGKYYEWYNTIQCKITNRYNKFGAICCKPTPRVLKTPIDYRCTPQCEHANKAKYKEPNKQFVYCTHDNNLRSADLRCPYPDKQKIVNTHQKLDRRTKFYLRRIVLESRKVTARHTLDLVDELVAKAHRLRDTVDPKNRKYFGVIDSVNYTVRIGALALRLLAHNFHSKATSKA
jgi:predicted RNase H-like HicB family nuclease